MTKYKSLRSRPFNRIIEESLAINCTKEWHWLMIHDETDERDKVRPYNIILSTKKLELTTIVELNFNYIINPINFILVNRGSDQLIKI